MCHFFCQNLTGEEGFSIEEWNKVYDEVKDFSEEMQRMILDPPDACKEQCFDCMAIVGETRVKTKQLTGKAEDSPARNAYLNWVKAGKPEHPYYPLTSH